MRCVRLGYEFRMILAGDEPGMIPQLDQFDQPGIRRCPGNDETLLFHRLLVFEIELVSMTMAFDGLSLAIQLFCKSSRNDVRWPTSQTHRSPFHSDFLLVLQQTDNRVRRVFFEFCAVGSLEGADIASELDRGDLHSETQSEVRQSFFPGVFARCDFAFDTSIPESSWYDDAGHRSERFRGIGSFQIFRVDPDNFDSAIIGRTGVSKRL